MASDKSIPSFTDTFLKQLSGTDPIIFKSLLNEDRAPYRRIAIINYIILNLIVITGGALIYSFKYELAATVATLISAGFTVGFLQLNIRKLINNITLELKFIFVVAALINCLLASLALSLFSIARLRDLSIVDISYYWTIENTFLFILGFFGMASLQYYLYITITSTQNDFYHRLLTERQKLLSEDLERQREQIAQQLRINLEIQNTKTSLQEIQDSDEVLDVELAKTIEELSGETDIDKLHSAASFQLNRKNIQKALQYINYAIELDDEKTIQDAEYFPRPELYELKARILNTLGDTERAKVMLDRYVELNDENKYRQNLTREIILERVVIENLPFFGNLNWNFTSGMNILLGKNGYGKSHLLRLLAALLYNDKQKIRDWIPTTTPINARGRLYVSSDHPINEEAITSLTSELQKLAKQRSELLTGEPLTINAGPSPRLKSNDKKMEELQEKIDAERRRIFVNKEGITSNIGRVPILAIPDSRFIDRSQSVIRNNSTISVDLKRDGATEFLYYLPFGPIINKGLFIVAQNNSFDFEQEPYSLIERVISELAGNRTGMGTTESFFKFSRIESSSTTGDYKLYVKIEESQEEVQLQNISQGTFSILAICLMIYRFLIELRPASPNSLKEKAIVFIDEIDAHLHPSWEQKIIGILRREFPNVQFFITAHSPLIVAGCLENEVAVIRHTDNGFSLEQSRENFIGKSTPELFQKIFEIEDKDELFLLYSTRNEDEIKSWIEKLESVKQEEGLNLDQKKELDGLYQQLNYIEQVNAIRSEKAKSAAQLSQVSFLQQRVAHLEDKLSNNNKMK
ncbi:AAA family ATPase [Larkinella bovis]|uniref:AAA family ATPase n=1 Tax=Larkinella bovis TaxID=683041 RepID=A0ABW0IDP9_9BACT